MSGSVGHKGFTVLGVVLVLAALIAPAVVLTPLLSRDITVSKEEETRRTLAKLVEVIAGNPEEGTFGFIGDVGRLPKSLEELNTLAGPPTLCDSAFNPSTATFHTTDGNTPHRGYLGMGWQGPYFKETVWADEHLRDAWGQVFRYTCPETTKLATDPTTGGQALTLRTGQITSAGPDGVFDTPDDIKSEPFHDRGHLFLTVTQEGTVNLAIGVTVTFYYPANGEQASQSSLLTTWVALDTAGTFGLEFKFASVPAGVRFAHIKFVELKKSGRPVGPTQHEFYHLDLKSDIANRIRVRIPGGTS